MNTVVAGAVRKWKSAVTISKARTYRAIFCTARAKKSTEHFGFEKVQRLDKLQAPSFVVVPAKGWGTGRRNYLGHHDRG
jgi:hypothetical protein